MRYTLLITFLLLLLNCKTTRKETALLDTHKYTQKELERKYYKYENIGTLSKQNDKKSTSFKPIIYTNVSESFYDKKKPKSFLSVSNSIPEDINFFIEKLDGQYVFYMEKEGKIIMREYGNYFDYNKLRDTDSLKWLTTKITTERQVYDLLQKNNIKYKFISKKDNEFKHQIKIQLEPSGYYSYITFSNNYIVSNIYYQAKDTMFFYNKIGFLIFNQ